jgi:hypothetical protein
MCNFWSVAGAFHLPSSLYLDNRQIAFMNLTCFRIGPHAPELIPARAERAWMDGTGQHFAYRCTPLTMANSTGWELLCPRDIKATWNGGPGLGDLVIEQGDLPEGDHLAHSHFGHGILTFHPGYLFRTDPKWGIWCRGAPNFPKDGIAPLDGLVETDWLPFTFTMNWLFTQPGTVTFEKGEPFCFILPLPHVELEAIRPRIVPLSDDPELVSEHAAWGAARSEFNTSLRDREQGTLKDKWQRFYLTGKSPRGLLAPDTHRTKRRMSVPVRPSSSATAAPRDVAAASPSPPVADADPGPSDRCPQNLIWIASYPKSGNTWIRAFLHNLLKEIAGQSDEAQDINRMNEQTVWEIPIKPFERVLGKPVGETSHSEIAQARPEVQRRLANSRKAPFFVKTHLCVGSDHHHPTINLNATLAAIYVIRNPLDVAISYAHHSKISVDDTIMTMATPGLKTKGNERNVYEVLGSWSQHVASWTGLTNRPVHVLRYEDMQANPLRLFAALARFLRLAPSEAQLKAAIAKSSFAELSRQEAEHGFNERPATANTFFRDGRAGQWRDFLSAEQIEAVVAAHAPIMQRFGYLPPDCGANIPLLRG